MWFKKRELYTNGDEKIETDICTLFEFEYTFKVRTYLFEIMLRNQRQLSKDLVIICNGCKAEFSFNSESYEELERKIESSA